MTLVNSLSPQLAQQIMALAEQFFDEETRSLAWIILSFMWFTTFYLLFQAILPWLQRWWGWLLEPFGMRSLTAYILHGLPILVILYYFTDSTNIWLNSLLTVVAILATWVLLKIPWVQKVIPK